MAATWESMLVPGQRIATSPEFSAHVRHQQEWRLHPVGPARALITQWAWRQRRRHDAPLAGLAAGPDTELNFALVPYHPGEQAPGTTGDQVRLIDAALAASPGGSSDWGVCTECGMGRAGRDEIPGLLDLHRQIVAAGRLVQRLYAVVPGILDQQNPFPLA